MTFYQADSLNAQYWLKWRQNIRTSRVYNGFSTTGIFDILLIPTSAPAHGYVFYVLAYAPYMYDQMLWASAPPNVRSWQISLQLAGQTYRPSILTPVILPPKYQLAFGSRFNKHKQVYLVGFDLKPENLIATNLIPTGDCANHTDHTKFPAQPDQSVLNSSRYLQHNQSSCASPANRDKLAVCKQVEQALQANLETKPADLEPLTKIAPAQQLVTLKLCSLQQSAQLHWAPGDYQLCDQAQGECEPAEFLLRVRKT